MQFYGVAMRNCPDHRGPEEYEPCHGVQARLVPQQREDRDAVDPVVAPRDGRDQQAGNGRRKRPPGVAQAALREHRARHSRDQHDEDQEQLRQPAITGVILLARASLERID